MNMEEAKQILKRNGINVYDAGNDKYKVAYQGGEVWEWGKHSGGLYSAREVIKIARCYTSDNKQETSIGRRLKRQTRHKRRAYERDNISHGRFDKFNPNDDSKQHGDRWSFD